MPKTLPVELGLDEYVPLVVAVGEVAAVEFEVVGVGARLQLQRDLRVVGVLAVDAFDLELALHAAALVHEVQGAQGLDGDEGLAALGGRLVAELGLFLDEHFVLGEVLAVYQRDA